MITYHAVRVVLSVVTKAQPLACSNQLSQETYNITSPNEKTMEEVRNREWFSQEPIRSGRLKIVDVIIPDFEETHQLEAPS